MYIQDLISKLSKNAVRLYNSDYYRKDSVDDELNNLSKVCIRWSELDFKARAVHKTNETDWDEYYNKDLFISALHKMISDHNPEIGITWDAIDYYLDTYCKIKTYHKPHKK